MTAPQTLQELLSQIEDVPRILEDDAYKDVDKIIAEDNWRQNFQTWMGNRRMKENINIFHFLIITEIVMAHDKFIDSAQCWAQPKLCNWRKYHQRQVFDDIMIHFFSEQTEDQIPLRNQGLFNLLSSYAEDAGKGDEVTKDRLKNLYKARDDSNVYSPLASVYNRFFKTTSANANPIAHLLSILST